MPDPVERVAAAAQTACLIEVMAPKPGNVSRGRDLPGLTYRDFVLSAIAIGDAFRRHAPGRPGRLILEAVRATRRQVGTNTNLGIVLLLAPLARAALDPSGGPLREALSRVLRRLDRRDARHAYMAIRLAEPGGLGRVPEQDVLREPSETLLRCMRLAADRDAIAREYASDYAATFEIGLATLRRLRDRHVPIPIAVAETYLELLARRPDTLVARRHGEARARALSRSARDILRHGGMLSERGRRMADRLDRRLRSARPPVNPGATADLTVASLFLWLLERTTPGQGIRRSRRRRGGSSRAPGSAGRRGPRGARSIRSAPARARRPPGRRRRAPRSSGRPRRRSRP